MKYPNASTGIKRIYVAEILSVLATALAIVVMILTASPVSWVLEVRHTSGETVPEK